MENRKAMLHGMLLIVAAAVLWGGSGVAGQYLVTQRGLDAGWVTTYRTLLGGTVMLLFLGVRRRGRIFQVWKNPKDAVQMAMFGLVGIGCNLYFYMLAVKHTNAPTATTLQYLSPAMIVVYTAVRTRRLPCRREVAAVLCALAGVLAISTHGHLRSLAISPAGLAIGIASGAFLAFYGVFPKRLLEKYGAVYTFSWAQFAGGVLMNFVLCPIWRFRLPAGSGLDTPLVLVLAYQLVFGTMVSYGIYLIGVSRIGPARASMISSLEPAATAALAAVLLHTPLAGMDYVGAALIMVCIIVLSLPDTRHAAAPG